MWEWRNEVITITDNVAASSRSLVFLLQLITVMNVVKNLSVDASEEHTWKILMSGVQITQAVCHT